MARGEMAIALPTVAALLPLLLGPTPWSDVTWNLNSTPKYERGDPINIAAHMDPGRNLPHDVEIELEHRAHGDHQGERGYLGRDGGVGRSPSPG
ncbi:hypothetical protein FIBSPDRAFT_870945 [Athelia psychrophila]|uniref:Uncharacterized protein n=1 Tax=Athelia psychrophila TaxID=1759441 RepID=A0A166ANY9_9AGAM|nr:hypothetical protein FIBSPDRAFT_870945 [Fibularhizoctonia sp. CBS 109695]